MIIYNISLYDYKQNEVVDNMHMIYWSKLHAPIDD